MTSKNNKKLKLALVISLLGAITALITAIVGPDGLPKLITSLRGQDSQPSGEPPSKVQPSGSPNVQNVQTNGDKNITIGGSNNRLGTIQQSGDGNCNNINVSGQSVTIICSPSSSGLSLPNLGGNNAASEPVKLQASIEGLQRGSNRFTLWLTNGTPNQSVDIPITHLSVSDDQGNTYELDHWTSHKLGLTKVVPPNGRIKLDYTLTSSILQNTSSVTFTLDNLWAKSTGSQFKTPLPPIQWTTKI
jgi:hypothetical protein